MAELAIRGFGEMQIGDDLRPFMVGVWQARFFCEYKGIELSEYQATISQLKGEGGLSDSVLFSDVLYSALAAGAKFRKRPIDFDADEVMLWVDVADKAEVAKLFEVVIALGREEPEAPGKATGPRTPK